MCGRSVLMKRAAFLPFLYRDPHWMSKLRPSESTGRGVFAKLGE